MRILEITQNVPYPPTDGGRIGIYRVADGLSRLGHSIEFVCPRPTGEQIPLELSQQFHVHSIEAQLETTLAGMACNLASGTPYTYAKHHIRGFGRLTLDAARDLRPDLIHTDFLHMATYGLAAAHQQQVPVILRAHNVDSSLMARFGDNSRGPRRWYAALQTARLLAYERRYLPQFRRVVAVTRSDADRLEAIAGVPVTDIPAGVDTEYFVPTYDPPDGNSIVSVALMSWAPNIASTLWFLEEVLPLIRDRIPSARLTVVGKNPPPAVRRYHDGASVEVTGFVDDIRPIVGSHAVFVVPTRVGSGIRIKILEAMAMGKAIVSTSVGCEGIEGISNGRNILLANDPTEFACEVVRLMTDGELRARLGAAGRQLVSDRYQWSAIARRFERLYEEVLTEHSRTSRGSVGRPESLARLPD
jgi:polysaccharide biosynthesis protein PslH